MTGRYRKRSEFPSTACGGRVRGIGTEPTEERFAYTVKVTVTALKEPLGVVKVTVPL
jgi:hypothetical protein